MNPEKTDLLIAQIAKLAAEAESLLAENERAARLHEIAEAQALVELDNVRLLRRQNEIATAKAARDEQLLLTEWRHANTLNFTGAVTGATVLPAIDRLHQFSIISPGEPITITFNSPGGSVIDGMALFDYIRFLRSAGHKITIIAMGMAASMAGILLQAGDVRVMAKGSWLLIHEVAFSAGGKIGEVEDTYEWAQRLKKQAATIFVERSGGLLTPEVLEQNWKRKDWWLSPDEALALGLIDEIR